MQSLHRAFLAGISLAAADQWRGLVVAPEHRCSLYSSRNYRYSQSLETRAVAAMGGRTYGPYIGSSFASTRQTDIEHIVARSEAHDCGLCAASVSTRHQFAGDLPKTSPWPARRRTAVAGRANAARDAAEWMPAIHRGGFVARIVDARCRYHLTIDRSEADALDVCSRSAIPQRWSFRAGRSRRLLLFQSLQDPKQVVLLASGTMTAMAGLPAVTRGTMALRLYRTAIRPIGLCVTGMAAGWYANRGRQQRGPLFACAE